MASKSQSSRQVPMRVLGLGFSRTGTKSLRDALLALGFNHTYHTFDSVFQSPEDCKAWTAAIRAKHDGVGKKFGREEFDQLLGHCQAVTDMPGAYFAPELIQAYPDAKVILTVRDVDDWYESVKATIHASQNNPYSKILKFTSKLLLMPNRHTYAMFDQLNKVLYGNDFEKNGRKSFEQHYELVRSLVPPENLLEYHVKDGWEPLCKFLDKPVPAEPVPFINQREKFNQVVKNENLEDLRDQAKRVLDIVAYVALGVSVFRAIAGRLPSFE